MEKSNMVLAAADVEQYARDGFCIVRDALEDREIERFAQAFRRHPPLHGPLPGEYPAPGRYTLAESCMADPDLGFVVGHPTIVEAARQLLEDDPVLTAFVVYDRTPGGPGIPKHNDYKRWRPVGSSMNWLFAIVPLDDFDAKRGQLFVSPGSHRLERVRRTAGRALEVDAAVVPDDDSFIDPQLTRGDLLLMNMHCWHRAAPNRSNRHRIGFFNKYAAAHCPPATGYYPFNDAAYRGLTTAGQKTVAFHSDKPIATARVLLQREDKYLLLDGAFPGGPTFHERAIPDWDLGNYVAAAHAGMRKQVKVETPWLTYVGDYDEGENLARLYAFELNHNGFPARYAGDWLTADEMRERGTHFGYEANAVQNWLDPSIVRGKGISQAQARVDQYAY